MPFRRSVRFFDIDLKVVQHPAHSSRPSLARSAPLARRRSAGRLVGAVSVWAALAGRGGADSTGRGAASGQIRARLAGTVASGCGLGLDKHRSLLFLPLCTELPTRVL